MSTLQTISCDPLCDVVAMTSTTRECKIPSIRLDDVAKGLV